MDFDKNSKETQVKWRSGTMPTDRLRDAKIITRMFVFWFLFLVGFAILLGVLSVFLEVSV